MSNPAAEKIADAVLYEGYVLYPYRASSAKNRYRWQIGLLVPCAYVAATGSDPSLAQTECVAELSGGATLHVRIRALHVQQRTIHKAPDAAGGSWESVAQLQVGDQQLIAWDEAVVCESLLGPFAIGDAALRCSSTWVLPPSAVSEPVHDASGALVARVLRQREEVCCSVHLETEPHGTLVKIHVRVENVTPTSAVTLSDRDVAVRQSLAAAHSILSLEHAAFVSLLDPPAHAAELAASCVNRHTFPVLVGTPPSRTTMLSSPILLYDYPTVAPESLGDYCDATEIDEMLTLRVMTLTDDEKREARATDARAARIIDQCVSASRDAIQQLHGAVRHIEPDTTGAASLDAWESFLNPPGSEPESAWVLVQGTRVTRGTRVRLEPTHRADSLDLCIRGRVGTVSAVHRTLEDTPYISVTLDDDPFGGEGERYRRALFFHPDELVPLDGEVSA